MPSRAIENCTFLPGRQINGFGTLMTAISRLEITTVIAARVNAIRSSR
jgi:hypothetical protein